MPSIYDFTANRLDGREENLSHYRGKVLLIVNVASKCGFTPQYKGLETLYQQHHDAGLEVLGFPCNQFAGQEPGDGEAIATFCEANYGVNFPLFEKIDVNGKNTHPLYQFLKESAPGLLGSKAIKWNFTKFLVNREGQVIERFGSKVVPAALEEPVSAVL